jgi:hypothetical protein
MVKLLKKRVTSDNIFKEKLYGDNYRYRVAFPNVKVGSVVDVETSQFSIPNEFYFQDVLPVKHAELVLEENTYLEYRKRACGYGQIPMSGNNRYVMQDLPAFKNEPFLSSSKNYMPKFEFDLLRISYPGYYKAFSTSWEAVNKMLRESDYFGGVLTNASGYMSNLSDSIKAICTTDLEKVQAAYEAIKRVKWDNTERVVSSTNALSMVYKKGVGNSADINMLLYLLLKRLDVNVLPVVMSTRDNGTLSLSSPTLYKLNYTIIAAFIDNQTYLMDASEKYAPFGVLPVRCLNNVGRIVNNTSGDWVNLKTDKLDKEVHSFQLELTPDLKFKGSYIAQKSDYAALNFRRDMSKYASHEKYVTQMEEHFPGLMVTDYKYEKLDSIYYPSVEKYTVEISNKAQQVNDLILISPLLIEQVTENPFKTDNRQFPVDFGYGQDKMVSVKIKIPEGYTVSELPKPMKVALPNGAGNAQVITQVANNELNVLYRLQIKKAVFSPDEYSYLQELYNQIIKKHSESVILKPTVNEARL